MAITKSKWTSRFIALFVAALAQVEGAFAATLWWDHPCGETSKACYTIQKKNTLGESWYDYGRVDGATCAPYPAGTSQAASTYNCSCSYPVDTGGSQGYYRVGADWCSQL